MDELSGTFDGIALPDVVRLLGDLRESGVLRISAGTTSGALTFIDGELQAASFGKEHGIDALDACALMLRDADFAFVEGGANTARDIYLTTQELRERLEATGRGTPSSMPSLDAVPHLADEPAPAAHQVTLERSTVQVLLLVDGHRTVREIIGERPIVPVLHDLAMLTRQGLIQIDAGQAVAIQEPALRPPTIAPPTPNGGPTSQEGILGVCPRLGFADDAGRHYSRPTALHRCYATSIPSLISSPEQRELCLGGRYPSCPRFSLPPAEPATPTTAVPPGVASRMSLARNMTVAAGEPEAIPDWIGGGPDPEAEAEATPRRPVPRRVMHVRGSLLIAGGAMVGLLAIVAGLMVLPMLQPVLAPAPPTAAPAFAPVATTAPIRTTAPLAIATSVPTLTAVPTAPPRQPTATAAQLPANVLVDTRFASGAQRDWLDSQPFAGWRDGAYRLSARTATRFVAVAVPSAAVPDDVVVSATLRKTGGPPGGGYGLIVRNQSAEALNGSNQSFDAYVFEAGDLGEFGVWRREGDRWVDLVPWTRSQAVRQGGSPNELIVRLSGSQLLLTINGIEVARVDDDVLAHGGVGVFAGGDNNEVALDRITVQVPN